MKVVMCGIVFGVIAAFLIGKSHAEELGIVIGKPDIIYRNQVD